MGKQRGDARVVDVGAALDEHGFVVIADVLDVATLASTRARVEYQLEHVREREPTWRPGGTIHLDQLFDLDDAFDVLWMADPVFAAVEHLLGPDFWMSSLGFRAPTPGHGAQELHRGSGPPRDDSHDHVTAIFALVPFTATNGATRLLPGSHRRWYDVAPSHHTNRHPDELIIECGAGSVLVFSEHVFHSGTRNESDRRRDAIIASYHRRSNGNGFGYGSPPRPETLERLGDLAARLLP